MGATCIGMTSMLFIAVLIAAFGIFYHFSSVMDLGRVVYNHRPGRCRTVRGPVHGSEGIELIRSEGIAFVTSGLLYLQPERAHIPGKIFLYDFNQKLAEEHLTAVELPIKGDQFDQKNFHPHGLSHWVIGGVIRLYVINHDNEFKHSIMFFDFDPSGPALVHKKTLKHSSMVRPNDIAAVGPDQLIFTNDGVAQTTMTNAIEFLVGYKGGSVYFTDGTTYTALITSKAGPNGIAYDAERNTLFVAIIMAEVVEAYELAKDKKSATLISSIPVHSGCDNLFVGDDGSIYSGCHPVAHLVAAHTHNCENQALKAPAQVLRLKYSADYKTASITEPYSNNGSELSASTQAVVFGNQMLIGSVCRTLLHCEISDLSVL